MERQILARLEAMAKHVNTMETQPGVVRWQIVGAVVRQDTLGPIVRRRPSAPLMQMEMLVSMGDLLLGQQGIVRVTVHLGTLVTRARQQILARMEEMAKHVNTMEAL